MKSAEYYECSDCGYSTPRWLGKCPSCEGWNTLVQCSTLPCSRASDGRGTIPDPLEITRISAEEDLNSRLITGDTEFDGIIGGGFTAGSVLLVGGEPGTGKSTLMLNIAARVAGDENKVIYVSSEESVTQVASRAVRLGLRKAGLFLLSEWSIEEILEACSRGAPALVVIDSIQTVACTEAGGAAGTPAQVRACTEKLVNYAKNEGGPVIVIIGHVTKEGGLAGPKVLEHLVDTVLMFEGDRTNVYRVLRTGKNRFGPSDGVAFYRMGEAGLEPVPDPSSVLLAGRRNNTAGTQVTTVMEGNRPVLAEIQALVAPAYGNMPGRGVTGLDLSRCMMIQAVLGRKCGVSLAGSDLWVNVAGGFRITETAADLAVAAAIASSLRDVPLSVYTVALGELSLTGELRPVHHLARRLEEAGRVGFRKAVVPAACSIPRVRDMKIIKVSELSAAINILLTGRSDA